MCAMAVIENTTTQYSWVKSFRFGCPLTTRPFSEWRIKNDLQKIVKTQVFALSIQMVFLARRRELQSSGREGELSGSPRSRRLDHRATGARRPVHGGT